MAKSEEAEKLKEKQGLKEEFIEFITKRSVSPIEYSIEVLRNT